jgi:signal transduction histidine kinase
VTSRELTSRLRGSRAIVSLPRYFVDPVVDLEASLRDRQAVLVLRFAVLLVCLVYTMLSAEPERYVSAAMGLFVVAVVGSLPPVGSHMVRWQPIVESVLATTVISLTTPLPNGLLPYLLVPALAAGLVGGVTGAILAGGLAGGVAIMSRPGDLTGVGGEEFTDLSLWILLALGLGFFGAWVRRARPAAGTSADVAAYSVAYQLLEQLRTVSRQLSGGLEPATVAGGVAERVQNELDGKGTVVVTRSERGVVIPLARAGRVPLQIEDSLELLGSDVDWHADRPFAVDSTVWIPLRAGDRTVAMAVCVGLNGGAPEMAVSEAANRLTRNVRDDAMRLETALLFEDVRSVATAEERRRLAREIHDGIAQELASLGYLIDDIATGTDDPESGSAVDLAKVRNEIRRIVSELRLSIFDLRSDMSAGSGLGDALSSYVREVGQRAGLIVHLVLDEGPRRLPASIEAELLRIAQEAVTNARKHSQAVNLWVTCVVDPPQAQIRVVDDGLGLGEAREDSFGLQIMAERAHRIGAHLMVTEREGGGTVVEVLLDPVRPRREVFT